MAVVDPDLQIRGGAGHPDPEIRGAPGLKKYFSALRASVWSKNKGGPEAPRPLPWIGNCQVKLFFVGKEKLEFSDSKRERDQKNVYFRKTLNCI